MSILNKLKLSWEWGAKNPKTIQEKEQQKTQAEMKATIDVNDAIERAVEEIENNKRNYPSG